jgi:hypothetical protein
LAPIHSEHVQSVYRRANCAAVKRRSAALKQIPCFEYVGKRLAWITPEKKRGEKYEGDVKSEPD